MPKSTHFHQAHDAMSTDRKFRPEDEHILEHEKQEFQESEKEKREELAAKKLAAEKKLADEEEKHGDE